MIYRFEDLELDTATRALRRAGAEIALEPQVFALLVLLVENGARVVTKDEIVERIWNGRSVSDSAIASRIKSARQALGDDGTAQRFIRTMHGVGFRFVAEVTTSAAPLIERVTALDAPEAPAPEGARPSIAVLPFRLIGDPGPHASIADALPGDLITELARLRWLFVISRASSFQFRGPDVDLAQVRAALSVRYCLTGVVDILGPALTISVELSDTEDRGVVWADRFRGQTAGVHEMREEIAHAVINALDLQIPLNEARRARLKAPGHLAAWDAYHVGLQHMYRFTRDDNARAAQLFTRAIELEPDFARAYAGLSFTNFQDSFLQYGDDYERSRQLAYRRAAEALDRDPLDPFAVSTMGRAHWISGDLETSLAWLDRANLLNPNSAQSTYAHAVVGQLAGQTAHTQQEIDTALALSPLDPLRYAMLATRAFAYTLNDDAEQAALWGERAARSPGAHAWIEVIAALCHSFNGDDARARAWIESARARAPTISQDGFMRAFPRRDDVFSERITTALTKLGI